MSKAPTIDSNQWYHMYVTTGPDQALIGNNPNKDGLTAAVSVNTTNLTSPTNRWQIFPINATTYALRCQSNGPEAWLGTKTGVNAETAPYLAQANISDTSAFWSIGSWGDDYWWLSNAANGTSLLSKKGDDFLEMARSIAGPNNGRKWKFDRIAAINDAQYSSVNLLGAVVATSTAAAGSLPSSTAPSTDATGINPWASTGLSTGKKTGVGAAVGVVAFIALAVLGRCFWRKRRQNKAVMKPTYEAVGNQHTATAGNPAPLTTNHEMNTDQDASKYEMPATGIAEVPVVERPAELPGHAVQR